MANRMIKASTTAFFTIPADSVVERDHILLANETATPRTLVLVIGFMDADTGEVVASETAMQDTLGITLVDYMDGGDLIDEVPE